MMMVVHMTTTSRAAEDIVAKGNAMAQVVLLIPKF